MASPTAEGARSILIVGNFLAETRKGTRGVCEELAHQLAAAGWKVRTTSSVENRVRRFADMVISLYRHRRRFSVAQVDVYSGASFVWAEAVCWILRRMNKPFILSLHGGHLPDFQRRWPGRVSQLLRSASAVTTPSGYLNAAFRTIRSDLILLPNALDCGKYPFRVRARPRPRLVWLRAFCEIYNPTLAPSVIAVLKSRFPDVRLNMIGPVRGDDSLNRTISLAEKLNVREQISFPGPIVKAEVPGALEAADIFVNTTNIDNTPMSVIEAMACGLCVVSTNVGGLPYLIEDGSDGLLVPPNDAVAMANAIERVLTDPQLSEQLSRNARSKAERMDWSLILSQWQDLLEKMVANRV